MQKDFSQKSMVSRENDFEKRPKKPKKSILLHNKSKLEKVVESWPPIISNFSKFLKFLLISKIMHF